MATYRGFRSTKFYLALLTMALVTAVYAFTGFAPAQFGEFCMALLGAAGIYSGSNAAEKFAGRRMPPAPPEGEQ